MSATALLSATGPNRLPNPCVPKGMTGIRRLLLPHRRRGRPVSGVVVTNALLPYYPQLFTLSTLLHQRHRVRVGFAAAASAGHPPSWLAMSPRSAVLSYGAYDYPAGA